ncbi:MAG TPA: DUF4386 domain-containing protein [Dermatophilaceae bacterium]|nr:DUF4386 domain-containing protein [Dermatophilaceae bacterium]
MTTTTRTPATTRSQRAPMDPLRRTAYVVGVLFVITYITSIAAKFAFYPPFLDNPDYIVGAGEDTRVLWGALAEMILIIANIGTAVALYPILKRRFPALSLGFVTARVMESVFIAVGILCVVTLVTMRQDFSGAVGGESTALATTSQALVALQQWTFNLGPGFVVGVGNGILLGYLMYRTGLVPRGMAMLGLVGGPLVVLSGTAVILGVIEAGSAAQTLACMPEFFWELSFGIYLIVKGFKPAPVTTGMLDAR